MTRQHRFRLLSALALGLVAAGALAACGDDSPSTEEATSEVCDAREDIGDTLTQLSRLDPTDRADLAEVREDIADDVEELGSAGQELAESQWDDLEQAWDDFRETVDDFDQDTSFAEAREQLTSVTDEITSAWDEFASNVDCG
jgi:ABC-type transporter Mla subunit MlaD